MYLPMKADAATAPGTGAASVKLLTTTNRPMDTHFHILNGSSIKREGRHERENVSNDKYDDYQTNEPGALSALKFKGSRGLNRTQKASWQRNEMDKRQV